jgi:hypothetical protein
MIRLRRRFVYGKGIARQSFCGLGTVAAARGRSRIQECRAGRLKYGGAGATLVGMRRWQTRLLSIATLAAFVSMNVGIPAPRGWRLCSSEASAASPAGPCCCGQRSGVRTCGCSRSPLKASPGGCCSKGAGSGVRPETAAPHGRPILKGEHDVVTVSCSCGTEPADVVLPTQPKLCSPQVARLAPAPVAAFVIDFSTHLRTRADAPDTPPPRLLASVA